MTITHSIDIHTHPSKLLTILIEGQKTEDQLNYIDSLLTLLYIELDKLPSNKRRVQALTRIIRTSIGVKV